MNIGFFLKKIRTEKGLTLKNVAQKIKLTASLVSQIENEKASPSLSSLEAILKYYSINISDFYKQIEQKELLFLPDSEAETLEIKNAGLKLKLLASKLANNSLEAYIVEMFVDAKISVETTDIALNGERLIYIMSGEAETKVEEDIYLMKKGDSINFKSFLKCVISNKKRNETCRFIIEGTPHLFKNLLLTGK